VHFVGVATMLFHFVLQTIMSDLVGSFQLAIPPS